MWSEQGDSPSLVTCKGESLPLESYCDAGTQIGLKVGKNFFPIKQSQSPETRRKPVLEKVEKFFDLENS